MDISFGLNGETVTASVNSGTETLLDFLRETQGLKGTKEGCNEGDCGACSVIMTGPDGTPKAVNSCILMLPQIQGRSIRTVEGISGPDGALHPVQTAMIDYHGSQCGFCTPGFITTMAAAHSNGDTDHDTALAGNLCRCTGYAPIVRAAQSAQDEPIPDWMAQNPISPTPLRSDGAIFCPTSADELADWYRDHPDATLVAGATDVGLWVTKSLANLSPIAFLNHIKDLGDIQDKGDHLRVGATVTIAQLMQAIKPLHDSLHSMFTRYGSPQVRNSATIGGNIANGSPIGDGPPALIALGATLHLRHGATRRDLALEDFFVEYGRQDRLPGEFVEGISIPKDMQNLRCYKLSKRFDQDISAVCGCFWVDQKDGIVTQARLAFGGMAGTPKRASGAEEILNANPLSPETMRRAAQALADDFTPMSDQRASADYRLQAAQGMLVRYGNDLAGADTDIRKVAP